MVILTKNPNLKKIFFFFVFFFIFLLCGWGGGGGGEGALELVNFFSQGIQI